MFLFADKSETLVVVLVALLARVEVGLDRSAVSGVDEVTCEVAAAPRCAIDSWPGGTCHVAC